MLSERQSDGLACLQVSKTASLEPPLHALHPASSWQSPFSKRPFSSSQPTEMVTRKFLKRSRPQEEIDRFGEGVSRKKRRLRHDLVTSRLSRPYATPATHIARGAWRLGVWARQRSSGGLLLRKGAILNSIAKRKKNAVSESRKDSELHEANVAPKSQSDSSHGLPLQTLLKTREVFTSSDYDAFDQEENQSSGNEEDEEEEEEGEEENASDNRAVYSDFRVLNSPDSDDEFGDALYSFDTLDTSYHLGIDHGEKAIHLVMENERKDEVSVAPITPEFLKSPCSGLVAVGV